MAELKRMYESEDQIPEAYQDLYVEREGKWVLNLTGGDPFSKPIDEFQRVYDARERERSQREELQKQLDDIKEKLGNLEPDHLDKIRDSLQSAEDAEQQKLLDEKKFEEAAERKFQRQIAELQRQINQLSEQSKQSDARYQALLDKHQSVKIHDQLKSALLDAGADPQKIEWIVTAESSKWEIDPETFDPVPIEWIDGGKTKITARGADGQPLTMEEQAKSLIRDNTWIALGSTGSGSSHQSGPGANGSFQIKESVVNSPGGHQAYVTMREQAHKAGAEVQVIPG